MHSRNHVNLLIMTVLMFIAMYWLMYAMVDRLANVYPNLNQVYMAGLMTAPMVLIELALALQLHFCFQGGRVPAGGVAGR
jgi:hypothetical protein